MSVFTFRFPRRPRPSRLWHGGKRRDYYRHVYLFSQHWEDFKDAWHARHPNAHCIRCGKRGRIDLHHLSYLNLGHETDADVVPLCRDCHRLAHSQG